MFSNFIPKKCSKNYQVYLKNYLRPTINNRIKMSNLKSVSPVTEHFSLFFSPIDALQFPTIYEIIDSVRVSARSRSLKNKLSRKKSRLDSVCCRGDDGNMAILEKNQLPTSMAVKVKGRGSCRDARRRYSQGCSRNKINKAEI